MSGKRSATSPRENISKKPPSQLQLETPLKEIIPKKSSTSTQPQHETELKRLVKIEFETLNGKPFYSQVTNDELLHVWVSVFKRSLNDLFGVTSMKTLTRHVRATYRLKAPMNLSELDGPNFSYENFLDDGAKEKTTGQILGFGAAKPAELGDVTIITVKTNSGVEASGVLNWLKLYGTLAPHSGFRTSKTSGLKTAIFETEIALR
jgi:hypothetical protein